MESSEGSFEKVFQYENNEESPRSLRFFFAELCSFTHTYIEQKEFGVVKYREDDEPWGPDLCLCHIYIHTHHTYYTHSSTRTFPPLGNMRARKALSLSRTRCKLSLALNVRDANV